eukprot:TRINITY_DN16054_c0_g1_i1.p2 TRINITY_DN16054_c0_g1~~TRINITY_DN16054_c0_g1_i1.p2  ORF type:complete len:619 (+),score=189.30 TRINITY_DN16054_c0_g1_i1:141-1997(+)
MAHTVTFVCAADSSVKHYSCNLASCTLEDLYAFAEESFPALGGTFTVCHGGSAVPRDGQVKAIDIGVSNGGLVVVDIAGGDAAAQLPCLPGPMRMPAAGPMASPPCMVPAMPFAHQPMATPMQFAPVFQQSPQLPMQQSPGMMQPMPQHSPGFPMHLSPGMATHSPVPAGVGMDMGGMSHQGMMTRASPPPVVPPALKPSAGGAAPPPRRHSSGRPCGLISLSTVGGQLCHYATNNEGSRALVAALEQQVGTPLPAGVVAELQRNFAQLATHQHGSKVARAMVQAMQPSEKSDLLLAACGDFFRIADSHCGCEVLADLITAGTGYEAAQAAAHALADAIRPMAASVHGRKVLLSAIECFALEVTDIIFGAIAECLLDLTTDQGSCITVQRCIDFARTPQQRDTLVSQIVEACSYLVCDPYGNYALQHVVKTQPPASAAVGRFACERLAEVACNKYGSNVVERCIEHGSDETRNALIREAMRPEVVSVLINDAFGNFVIQSCVEWCPREGFAWLCDVVTPLALRSPYGYRIENKVARRRRGPHGHGQQDRRQVGHRGSGGGGRVPLGALPRHTQGYHAAVKHGDQHPAAPGRGGYGASPQRAAHRHPQVCPASPGSPAC